MKHGISIRGSRVCFISSNMISIKVRGARKNRRLQHLVKNATYFYLKTLCPRIRKINIEVQIVDNLSQTERVHGDCCQCGVDDPDIDYIIRLNLNESYHFMLTILAHEMVHLKQYVRRELILYSGDTQGARWKGVYCSEYDYANAPWEKEADERELELYMAFFESCSLLKEYK